VAAAAVSVSPRWTWAAGAAGQMSFLVSPTAGAGALLFAQGAAPGTAVLGPVLRAGLFVRRSDVAAASGAGARFQWAGSLVEGCPVRLAVTDARLALHACLAFHLGVLRGEGRDLEQPKKTTDLWSDLGPVARIRLAVSPQLFLELEGMLVFPLRRLTFDVQDVGPAQAPTTVFTVPVLGALVGMGVAYEFR
jgi:hypothetical protein